MTISELIEQLKILQDIHGDLPVKTHDWEWGDQDASKAVYSDWMAKSDSYILIKNNSLKYLGF